MLINHFGEYDPVKFEPDNKRYIQKFITDVFFWDLRDQNSNNL